MWHSVPTWEKKARTLERGHALWTRHSSTEVILRTETALCTTHPVTSSSCDLCLPPYSNAYAERASDDHLCYANT